LSIVKNNIDLNDRCFIFNRKKIMKNKHRASLSSEIADRQNVLRRLRDLRLRCRLSMRELAKQADVSPSYVSGVERGRISPTIATMRKMLNAMGSDLGDFFTSAPVRNDSCVFRREAMRSTAEKNRCYTFIFPRRKDIKLEMIEEEYTAGDKPEYEKINADLAGYVISGEFLLDIRGEPHQKLRTGDAFYIPAGTSVRGHCIKSKSARLITVQVPPNY
jgi:transcriptional regulator with XRE-family HTH domain